MLARFELDMTRTAVLVDFGGVLTTSVLQAFEEFGVSVGAARGLLLELLSNDAACRKLLVEHESGRIDADAFDRGFRRAALTRTAWRSTPSGSRRGCRPVCVATTTPCG